MTEEGLFEAPLFDANFVAQFFGHENRYLVDQWRQRQQGPSYYRLGDSPKARIRYSLRDMILYALQDAAQTNSNPR